MEPLTLVLVSMTTGLFVGSLLEFTFHIYEHIGELLLKSKTVCRLAHVPYP